VIPNDGERYHHGEAIATGCVEVDGQRSGQQTLLQETSVTCSPMTEWRNPIRLYQEENEPLGLSMVGTLPYVSNMPLKGPVR
jgi:hypothetical protein